jgi:hypothetical protein
VGNVIFQSVGGQVVQVVLDDNMIAVKIHIVLQK